MAAAIAILAGCDQSQPVDGLTMPEINSRAIPKILCDNSVGSGFVIGSRKVISARHVMTGRCRAPAAQRRPSVTLAPQSQDPMHDYVALRASDSMGSAKLNISCQPMTTGETYWLVGYPRGGDLTIKEGVALDDYVNGIDAKAEISTLHLRKMNTEIDFGMSGGPVINRNGEVVALISARDSRRSDVAMVKELADTELCRS